MYIYYCVEKTDMSVQISQLVYSLIIVKLFQSGGNTFQVPNFLIPVWVRFSVNPLIAIQLCYESQLFSVCADSIECWNWYAMCFDRVVFTVVAKLLAGLCSDDNETMA